MHVQGCESIYMLHTDKQFSKVNVRSVEIDERLSGGTHTQEGDRQWQRLNHKAPEWLHHIQLLRYVFKTHLQTHKKLGKEWGE